jgi:hypothetical protein
MWNETRSKPAYVNPLKTGNGRVPINATKVVQIHDILDTSCQDILDTFLRGLKSRKGKQECLGGGMKCLMNDCDLQF